MPVSGTVIQSVRSYDARYPLAAGAGTDAVHSESEYCLAVTRLDTDGALTATGMVLTLGEGNRIVCEPHRPSRALPGGKRN
jgi:L-fuconate dehydratase